MPMYVNKGLASESAPSPQSQVCAPRREFPTTTWAQDYDLRNTFLDPKRPADDLLRVKTEPAKVGDKEFDLAPLPLKYEEGQRTRDYYEEPQQLFSVPPGADQWMH